MDEVEGREEGCFDLRNVTNHLRAALMDNSDVGFAQYILAWTELNKMFPLLGRLFSFVQGDVTEKIHILEDYMSGPEKDKFSSINAMTEFELSIKRSHTTKPPSASRTLLRLHRAMEFVIRFISDVHDSEETEKMAPVARKAYDDTLAHYHPWLVRQGVHLAVHTLPHRIDLVESMSGHLGAIDAQEAMNQMIQAGNEVYSRVQKIYSHFEILNLP